MRAALDFEAALAEAEAAEGLIPAQDATAIISALPQPHPSIPRSLPKRQPMRARSPFRWCAACATRLPKTIKTQRKNVHRGATSQDVADTALMLQAKAAGALIEMELDRMTSALAALAEVHAATPMLGRTLLQGALPITFGLKVANWLLAVDEAASRFAVEQKAR